MTNKDKYKTPEERDKGFSKFCRSQGDCQNCQICKAVSITRESRNCKFAWLTLEAEVEENESDKAVLTNEEKYKSVEEQTEAFQKFCIDVYGCSCSKCPAYRDNVSCDFVWLTLKSEEKGENND